MSTNISYEKFHEISPSYQKMGNNNLKKKAIVIAGPTACGKSLVAFNIAKMVRGEIISADSMQVYKGMDIGTAKPSYEERLEIPHHLIDICELTESFNVLKFYNEASKLCNEIFLRGNVPIIVGGTGFYLRALIHGPPAGPPPNYEIRKHLIEEIKKFGVEKLYQKLCYYDPKYGKTVSPSDHRKLIRGLEIIYVTGKEVSDFPKMKDMDRKLNFMFFCWFIYFPKDILYQLIEKRCDEMISRGFVEEVEGLLDSGLEKNLSASQAIGYRQCLKFIKSKRTEEDWANFVLEFKKASCKYAKRQFTWFNNENLFNWINILQNGYRKTMEIIVSNFN